MKYYLIAGEASGDLHASHLMRSLQQRDPDAEFRFYGGDMMQAVGGTLVQHYRELAYMGFIPVLMHLRTILRGMKHCQQDILQWQPDALILVDYPGFNLKIAKAMNNRKLEGSKNRRTENSKDRNLEKSKSKKVEQSNSRGVEKQKKQQVFSGRIFYYISPKIWAWKEHRIKQIRRDIDRLYSILPFEVDFFEGKHHYPIDYVGNPTVDEVAAYKAEHPVDFEAFLQRHNLPHRPIIALLPGSRRQEITGNLATMIKAAAQQVPAYQLVITGAPGIEPEFYTQLFEANANALAGTDIRVVFGHTYDVLQHATAALVTSGTATLETALFNVPQVVCYHMRCGRLVKAIKPYFLKVPYISLVNLIADSEVVPELVGSDMNPTTLGQHLASILPDGARRQSMLDGYHLMAQRLGEPGAPEHAATLMKERLKS